jgi:hypothetical protein
MVPNFPSAVQSARGNRENRENPVWKLPMIPLLFASADLWSDAVFAVMLQFPSFLVWLVFFYKWGYKGMVMERVCGRRDCRAEYVFPMPMRGRACLPSPSPDDAGRGGALSILPFGKLFPEPSGGAPKLPGNAPGLSGNAPGPSGNAPGLSGNAPGPSGNAPKLPWNAPGPSGNAPGTPGGAFPAGRDEDGYHITTYAAFPRLQFWESRFKLRGKSGLPAAFSKSLSQNRALFARRS